MKEYLKYIVVAFMTIMVSCEADPNEGLPSFSNSLPLYVQLGSPGSLNSVEGADVSVTIEIPEVVYEDVNVDWSVSGDFTASGTATIIEGDLTTNVVVTIPDDNVAGGGGTATFTLTAVDNGLTLGRQNAANSIIQTVLNWTDND